MKHHYTVHFPLCRCFLNSWTHVLESFWISFESSRAILFCTVGTAARRLECTPSRPRRRPGSQQRGGPCADRSSSGANALENLGEQEISKRTKKNLLQRIHSALCRNCRHWRHCRLAAGILRNPYRPYHLLAVGVMAAPTLPWHVTTWLMYGATLHIGYWSCAAGAYQIQVDETERYRNCATLLRLRFHLALANWPCVELL